MNCSKCIPRNTAKEELERIEQRKKELGCEEPTETPQFQDTDTRENLYRCPLALVTQVSWLMVELYNFAEMGFLPFSGGVMDQPAYLAKRISAVRKYKIKYEIEEQEKNKKGK